MNSAYPADWDFYEQVVAGNPPSGKVLIPHAETGELVPVDLLEATPERLFQLYGIPKDRQEESLHAYRDFIRSRMPYWDDNAVPAFIPLLEA